MGKNNLLKTRQDRKCTDNGAHCFEGRSDWVELMSVKNHQNQDDYAVIGKKYIRDICVHCGKVVERKEELD